MTDIRIRMGLHHRQRQQAADLYWQAFGGKLGRILGPRRLALAYLARVMRVDQCITASAPDGTLIGIAGFKTPQGTFAGGTPFDLNAVYGPIGGRLRGAVLRLGNSDADMTRFLIEGLCIAPDWRGRGIGTALIEAVAAEGRARGYPALRVDVVDRNARARALYERLGFALDRTTPAGPLRWLMGYAAIHTLIRPL